MAVASFGKGRRLLTSGDFTFVFDSATFKVSHQHYLLLARENTLGQARLGLVVAKKNIRLATRRNRTKRVARETFRHSCQLLNSLDVVFLPRKGFDTLQPAFQTQLLLEAWKRLAKKSGNAP
jgi:ribonuclease P protein component